MPTLISCYTEWQGSKCVLRSPRPTIGHKMLSLQECRSRPKVLGCLSLPIPDLGFKHTTSLSRGVCFSAWSRKPWWIIRANLCVFLFHLINLTASEFSYSDFCWEKLSQKMTFVGRKELLLFLIHLTTITIIIFSLGYAIREE